MAARRDLVFDVTVIGAGIEGSATAYQLSKMGSGKKIALVEQFNVGHGRGSSTGESRVTRMGYFKLLYTEMMKECFSLWGELELESGKDIYVPTGQMTFGPGESSSPWCIQVITDTLNAQGLPHEVLDAEETTKRFPVLKQLPSDYKCVVEEHAGILRASKALEAFQGEFVKNGGVILENCKVEKIVPGSIVKLHTSKGIITTRRLVITAGVWAPPLLKSIGLDLPLKVHKVNVYYWAVKNTHLLSPPQMPVFMFHSGKVGKLSNDVYGLPICEYPGLVKICLNGGPEADPENRDFVPDTSSIPVVSEFIRTHFNFVETEPSIVELCMYTLTPDRDFILDRHHFYSNIIIGAGFSGHGFKLAPVVGKILSELTLDLPPSYDLKTFTIDRFLPRGKL